MKRLVLGVGTKFPNLLPKYGFLAAIVTAGALLIALVPVSLAAGPRAFDTTPDITSDSPLGYYIWRSDGTIHVRTHGPGSEHNFDAVLTTNGTFENVDPVRLEGTQGDHIEIRDGGHQLVMHVHTYDGEDGVNFNVGVRTEVPNLLATSEARDGEHLRFNLKLDNQDIATDSIFIGKEGRHPKHNPFTVEL